MPTGPGQVETLAWVSAVRQPPSEKEVAALPVKQAWQLERQCSLQLSVPQLVLQRCYHQLSAGLWIYFVHVKVKDRNVLPACRLERFDWPTWLTAR